MPSMQCRFMKRAVMKKQQIKRYLSMAALFLAAIFAVVTSWQKGGFQHNALQDAELVIQMLDVGQADSIVVLSGGKSLLIDAGDGDDFETISKALGALGIKKLDMVVATHPHADHIGNMAQVVKKFKPLHYYYTDCPADTDAYYDAMSAANKYAGSMELLTQGMVLELGEAALTVLSPEAGFENKEVNNYSAVLLLEYGDFSGLLTGDAEAKVEQNLLEQGALPDVDLLKVGHHGSYTGTTKEFLAAVQPEIGIISVGQDNQYGMPHERPLRDLKESNTQVLRTDLNGPITVVYQDGDYAVYSQK